MSVRQKKLLSNLLFAGGFLLAVLGVLLTATGAELLLIAGFGMLALGVVAALAGIVIGFIPARRS